METLYKILNRIKMFFGGGIATERDLNMSALDIAIDTVVGNAIPGDYLEFGVYRGDSFVRAYKRFKKHSNISDRRFVAFDSFEGLPESSEHNKPKHYHAGAYQAPLDVFKKRIQQKGVDLKNVLCVEGFYAKTLTQETKDKHQIHHCAVAYIDVDLYKSSVPVFDFLTDIISTGTVLVIDDWFRHLGVPTAGIQKACAEWLAKNPSIQLIPLHQWRRVAFIVLKK